MLLSSALLISALLISALLISALPAPLDLTNDLFLNLQTEMSVGRVQMNFLHLLSSEAVQHVTVHCLNTAVWSEADGRPPGPHAAAFRSWSGELIHAGGELAPHVTEDSCWVSGDQAGQGGGTEGSGWLASAC